jgi:FMN phosphatase YigB (HAD superfamily)
LFDALFTDYENTYQIFFDDSIRNIQAGKQIGMHTVLVNISRLVNVAQIMLMGTLLMQMYEPMYQVGTSERIKGADHALESIHNMKEAFPELWEEAVKDEDVRNSSKVGIETSVIA